MMNENLSNTARSVKTGLERIPSLTVAGDSGLPGNFYLSFISVPAVIQLDGRGNVVWADELSAKTEPIRDSYPISDDREFPDARGWWDFKKIIGIDGKVYYSYHESVKNADNYGVSGYHPGKRVILDERHNPIRTSPLSLSADPEYGVRDGDYVDGHDFLMFSPDHYILSSYRRDEGSDLVYSYLQEVWRGKVVWRWASQNHPELLELTKKYPHNDKALPDYIHFNSMCVDPTDDHLICSFRHINTIMKISRGKKAGPVGQIIWKLSGDADDFELTDKQKTCYQHYVRFDGNYTITCFDNRNDSHDTRLMRYVFDRAHRKVMQVDTHCIKGKYSSACGSVQHIRGGIYVIGWGKAEYENDPHINERECMTVYDFDRDKVLMSISMDSHHGFNFTYRCAYCE